MQSHVESDEGGPSQSSPEWDAAEREPPESGDDTGEL